MMDQETREALEGSIAKWQAIVDGDGEDHGAENCPLCIKFALYTSSPNHCNGCPIMESTGHRGCCGSPYDAWWENKGLDFRTINTSDPEHQAKLRELARAELDFLISLRPSA